MAEQDLSISQLPPLALPVQGSDLLHVSRGGDDFRISRTELVRLLLDQLSNTAISGTASGQALVFNAAAGKWANQFVSWAAISGKPGTFPPTAHTHLWGEITDAPTELPVAAHSHAWTDLTDVPSSFPSEPHTHRWDDLTGIPAAFPAEAHGHPWSEITGTPATFPPDVHDHNDLYYSRTELHTSAAGGQVHWDNITNKPETFGTGDMSRSVYDPDDDGVVSAAASVPWSGITGTPATFPPDAHVHDDRYYTEAELSQSGAGGSVHWDNLAGKPTAFTPVDHTHDDRYFTDAELTTPGGGGAVHWDNVTNKPAEFGTGDMEKVVYDPDADGIVDVAAAAPWSGITGRPAAFPPDAHTHNDLYSLLGHDHDAAYSAIAHTHEQLDNHIAAAAPHSGYPTLGQVREKLTGPRTYYVSSSWGNDSSDGLTWDTAFRTVQAAINKVTTSLDFGGQMVTIQLANYQTYDAFSITGAWTGGGSLAIQGDVAVPANCIISTAGTSVYISATLPGLLTIQGMELRSGSNGIHHEGVGLVKYGAIRFGTTGNFHVYTSNVGSSLMQSSKCFVVGNAVAHWVANVVSLIRTGAQALEFSAGVTFSFTFTYVTRNSVLEAPNMAFTGSFTGSRFLVDSGGIIYANANQATYFPGSSAGTVGGGGQWI